jgi:hypothetical protein
MKTVAVNRTGKIACQFAAALLVAAPWALASETPSGNALQGHLIKKPGLFKSLTEPPCSYCSTENRKGFVDSTDRVLAWIRADHNGGAVPLRHFLSGPRVINDTYGLFFFDADGGFVSAFKKDYGYEFYGWLNGVMIVKGPDGTLWSALSGVGLDGPKKGQRLERIANFMTEWGYWLMLHPESTAYNLFDGKKYFATDLPKDLSAEAKGSMGQVDSRLQPLAPVIGVELGGQGKAFPLDLARERACYTDTVDGVSFVVFSYKPTQSAIAFRSAIEGRTLTFYADDISPETAPFKDKETGTRWTLAGRAVDGPLKGKELEWIPSVQCRWYAWAATYPQTAVFKPAE